MFYSSLMDVSFSAFWHEKSLALNAKFIFACLLFRELLFYISYFTLASNKKWNSFAFYIFYFFASVISCAFYLDRWLINSRLIWIIKREITCVGEVGRPALKCRKVKSWSLRVLKWKDLWDTLEQKPQTRNPTYRCKLWCSMDVHYWIFMWVSVHWIPQFNSW